MSILRIFILPMMILFITSNLSATLSNIQGPSTVQQGQTVTVTVDYTVPTNRDIYLTFQYDHAPWTSFVSQRVHVGAGTDTATLTFTVPQDMPINNDYLFYIIETTVGGYWSNKFDEIGTSSVNVTAANGTPAIDKITSFDAPTEVKAGETITVSVSYDVSQERTIQVGFQQNHAPGTGWNWTYKNVTGKGTVDLSFQIPDDQPLGNGYQIPILLYPLGGNWNNRLDNENVNPVNLTAQDTTLPCTVETPENLIKNACVEQTTTPWRSYNGRPSWVNNEGHSGTHSLKLENNVVTRSGWNYPVIPIDHQKTITFGGWSKAENVANTALYTLDFHVVFADKTDKWFYPPELHFNKGTHDWEQVELTKTFDKEVVSIKPYVLLYNGTGTAWFDDIYVIPKNTNTDTPPIMNAIENYSHKVDTLFSLDLSSYVELTEEDEIKTYVLDCDGGIPEGLSFDYSSGVLNGLPTKVGIYNCDASANDKDGRSNTVGFTLEITEKSVNLADGFDIVWMAEDWTKGQDPREDAYSRKQVYHKQSPDANGLYGGTAIIKEMYIRENGVERLILGKDFILPGTSESSYEYKGGYRGTLRTFNTTGHYLCKDAVNDGASGCIGPTKKSAEVGTNEWTSIARAAFSDINLNHYIEKYGGASYFTNYEHRDKATSIHRLSYDDKGIKVGFAGDGYFFVSERGGNNSFLVIAYDKDEKELGHVYIEQANGDHCSLATNDTPYKPSGRMQNNVQEICIALYPLQKLAKPGQYIKHIELWAASTDDNQIMVMVKLW
ncbi:MAG: Ig domain-containing protein [Sulfurovum sp.]|nr:Ig domain-containing protein [Sulfurovum sp.]